MKINTSTKIVDIQTEFTEMFPGLKIEFFSKDRKSKKVFSTREEFDAAMTIGDISNTIQPAEIDLSPELSVGDVEQSIENQFGFSAQIHRRSNKLWLQTTTTDEWSLADQNRKGIHSTQQ